MAVQYCLKTGIVISPTLLFLLTIALADVFSFFVIYSFHYIGLSLPTLYSFLGILVF
jgi:hypothetical protein